MSEILDQPRVKKTPILKVLPYLNENSENMGLTKYHMVLHDGAVHNESLTCLEKNGVKRWLTGLNEFAPEIVLLKGDDKVAAILDIRKKVVFLERALGSNEIDEDDEKFWDKVKTVHPNNHSFWDKISVSPGNEPLFLNPLDPHDLIKICGIEAGGFSIIAKSFEDAQTSSTPPKFYLDKATHTASTKTEIKKIKNKAIENLSKFFNKGGKTLFYISKIVNPNGYQYKNDTPMDVIYDYLDEYINGKGIQKGVKLAAVNFNTVCELSPDDLRIKATIADASFYKIIVTKGDGLLYHRLSDTILGKNISEVLNFFKNPVNTEIWQNVYDEVEKYWKD